jgi:hypothetical protein
VAERKEVTEGQWIWPEEEGMREVWIEDGEGGGMYIREGKKRRWEQKEKNE